MAFLFFWQGLHTFAHLLHTLQKSHEFFASLAQRVFRCTKIKLVGARPLHLAYARPFGRSKAPLGLSLLRNRGILLSEETKNPNPSPIEKRFGFSLFGAMEGTRAPGLLIRSARRAIPSIFGSYVLTSFLCDTSQVLSFEFLHPLSDFATICTLCTF